MAHSTIEFIKAALRNPKEVSTIFPTGRALAESLLDAAQMEKTKTIVELGAGTGAITKHLAPRLDPQMSYLGIELDQRMVEVLRRDFPSLKFEVGPAENLTEWVGDGKVDVIISSLPWSLFSDETQTRTINAILRALKPGGVFVTYICINALWYPQARALVRRLRASFSEVTKSELEWRNIPPAYVFRSTK